MTKPLLSEDESLQILARCTDNEETVNVHELLREMQSAILARLAAGVELPPASGWRYREAGTNDAWRLIDNPWAEEVENPRWEHERLFSEFDFATTLAAVRAELDRATKSLEHTRYWYGTRLERLWHWAHEELTEPQKSRYFSIVANGTADVNEPPTYARQLNVMNHDLKRSEAELASVTAERDALLIAAFKDAMHKEAGE